MYFGGHFGRHVEKSLFQCFDLGKLLVCYKVHLMLIESIEKHFLAVFWGSNLILIRLRPQFTCVTKGALQKFYLLA